MIPSLDGGDALVDLVAALAPAGPVIVVDDGSTDGSPERAAAAGAQVLANAGAPGPAGARNTGLHAAATEFVAFLDADCIAAPGWRAGLGAMLAADPSLALVAPRVRSAPGPGALARYETRHSPLDLGAAPSLVGPGRRISYLPAAALVARREDLLAAGRLRRGAPLRRGRRPRLAPLGGGTAGALRAGARGAPRAAGIARRPGPSAGRLRRLGAGARSAPSRRRGAAAGGTAQRRRLVRRCRVWAAGARRRDRDLSGDRLLARERRAGPPRPRRRRPPRAGRRRAPPGPRAHPRVAAADPRRLHREPPRPPHRRGGAARRRLRRRRPTATAAQRTRHRRRRPGLDPARLLALRALDNAAYAGGLWRAAIAERSPGALLPAAPSPHPE